MNKRRQSPLQVYETAVILRRDLMFYMIEHFCSEKLYREKVITDKGTEIKTTESYPEDAVKFYRETILILLRELTRVISRGNAIYPTTIEDIKHREDFQKQAIEICCNLQAELNCIATTFEDQVQGFLSFADRIGILMVQIKKWKKSNKKFEAKINNSFK